MFSPRQIQSRVEWSDPDGVKLYTISADGGHVDHSAFLPQLVDMKRRVAVEWSTTPAFAIFHRGSTALYLVLAWWGNANELFTRVAVLEQNKWIEDPNRFSFCLWDLEVMWHERQYFIDSVYCAEPDLASYRLKRLGAA